MMKKVLSLLLALLTAMTLWGCGFQNQQGATDASDFQNNSNIKRLDMISLSQNIEEIAQYDLSKNKVFGSAYYVYQDGEEFEKCYGTTSLNSDSPITNSTIFRLASMTKPITTIAEAIFQTFAADPLVTCSYEEAKELFKEMVMNTKEYLTSYDLTGLL